MSDNKETPVGIAIDAGTTHESMYDEPVKWEDLVDARTSTVTTLMEQQTLLAELVETEQDKINNDAEIFAIIDGLGKTFNDLAGDINTLSIEHATETTEVEVKGNKVTIPTEYKSGVITDSDGELAYLTLGSNYVAIEEKIAHITSTTYIDIYTKLKMDVTDLVDAANTGVEVQKDIIDGK